MRKNFNPKFSRRGAALAMQLALTLGATTMAASVLAAGGQSILSAKVDPLPLYASPAAPQPASSIHASGLPWDVLESRDDFYRVKIGGKDYWVDSMTVHASQAVKAACERSAGGAIIAADLGASTNRCK